MTNVVILGSGSREQVIKEYIKHNTFMCSTKEDIIKLSQKIHIDLVIVGSETELANGIVDDLDQDCFGPSKYAAQIEGSKEFSKLFMKENDIVTSDFVIITNQKDALNYINQHECDYVIKLDKLYGGKGVFIPESTQESIELIKILYAKNENEKLIIEKKIYGVECSVMGFCNGEDVYLMPQIMDYKRINDDDKGLNTGGMGAIGPVSVLNADELELIKSYMLKVVKKLKFKGVLYTGVMKTEQGCYVLEFNCRFGDPETQVALNLLDSDLYTIMLKCVYGSKCAIKWKKKSCANVIMSHIEYPYKKQDKLLKINAGKLDDDIKVYWANSIMIDNDRYSKGGRVCSVVHVSDDLRYSLEKIYNCIYNINYDGRYYRKDIGIKYLTNHDNNKKVKIALIGSGNGTSIAKLLEIKDDINISVEVIVSNKQSGILEKGKNFGIPTVYLPIKNQETYYDTLTNILKTFDIDLIFLVGFNKIVSAKFCNYYKGKLFNIHPSLLPDYNGLYDMAVHKKVLENNDAVSGCTLHHVTSEVDRGRIVLQKQIKLEIIKTDVELKKEIQKLESDVIIDFIKLFQNTNIDYAFSGVDIDKASLFIDKIKNKHIGSFCSLFEMNGNTYGASTDGVGTKLDLAIKHNKYDTIGIDLVAMCVNDLLVRGIRPLIFLDYIATDKLDNTVLVKVVNSIKNGCESANCELIGGETAEMPGIYVTNGLDLAGFSVGVLEHDLYPKIDLVESGCKIYGIRSTGIHSNGYSLVRKLLKYHDYDVNTLLKPTKIYTECLELIKKYKNDLIGMAHITGGGLIGNVKRILPEHLTAEFNVDIDKEFYWIMEKSGMSYTEMISTFNCGYGIALIFKKDFICLEYNEIGIVI